MIIIIKYNNLGQPYTILSRFRVKKGEEYVEYCRVKFFNTSSQQVVESSLVKTGEFGDESLDWVEVLFNDDREAKIEDEEVVAELTKYIVTNADDEEFEVTDLDEFCKENNLLLESIEAILEGKQKTHRKWTIRKA